MVADLVLEERVLQLVPGLPEKKKPVPWVVGDFKGSELEFLFQLFHNPDFYDVRAEQKVIRGERAALACKLKYGNDRDAEDVTSVLSRRREQRRKYEIMNADAMPELPEGLVLPPLPTNNHGNQYTKGTHTSPWQTYNDDLGFTALQYAFWLALHPDNRIPLQYNRIPKLSRFSGEVQTTSPDFEKIAPEVRAEYGINITADAVFQAFATHSKDRMEFYKTLASKGLDLKYAS
jgi:hypothetical protein